MEVVVRFFALYRERAGCNHFSLEISDGSTVEYLTGEVRRHFPGLAPPEVKSAARGWCRERLASRGRRTIAVGNNRSHSLSIRARPKRLIWGRLPAVRRAAEWT